MSAVVSGVVSLGLATALLAGCGGATSSDDIAGPVDIGGDRTIYVECTGSGTPSVVLIPGSRSSHEAWQVVAPSREVRPADLAPSDDAVFSRLAEVTRVCTYDRPGVPLLDGSMSASSLVPQPTTAQQGAADLDAWLTAADVPAPYLLVAHSWAGLIAVRFAQEHPERTVGLVLVDPASGQLRDALTPEQWQRFLDIASDLLDGSNAEVPDYAHTVDEVASGPAVPDVPAVVITSDHPFDFGIGTDTGDDTWSRWLTAQDELAESLDARHITKTDSGHLIMIEQPDLVASAVREVVDEVRATQ